MTSNDDSPLCEALEHWVQTTRQENPWLVVQREGLFWYALWFHPTVNHNYEPVNRAKAEVVQICRSLGINPVDCYIMFLRGQVEIPQDILERPEAFKDALLFFINGTTPYWTPSSEVIKVVNAIIKEETLAYYKDCLR